MCDLVCLVIGFFCFVFVWSLCWFVFVVGLLRSGGLFVSVCFFVCVFVFLCVWVLFVGAVVDFCVFCGIFFQAGYLCSLEVRLINRYSDEDIEEVIVLTRLLHRSG